MAFAKEQLAIKEKLEKKGFDVLVTDNIGKYAADQNIKKSFEEELRVSLEHDIMRDFFNKLNEADAFLVCNYDRKGVKGYLGTSVLMELGLAHYLKKKIFLMT